MLAETLIETGGDRPAAVPVGAVVGRRLDRLVRRSEPSEVGEP